MSAYALIAEFDPQQTAIYHQCLERHGLEAVLVRDGRAAARVLRARGAPTLLICDLSLPQADGFSVIAELRRTDPKLLYWFERRSLGDDRIYHYEVAYGERVYRVTLGLAPDNKVSQFGLRRQ